MTTSYWLLNNGAAITTMMRMAAAWPPLAHVRREPTLSALRARLRAGMPRDEFFELLDELGVRFRLPAASADVVAVSLANGSELLCFVGDHLTYAEHDGGVVLEYLPALLR